MFIVCMFTFSCRRCSSVVEHVIGNDGVASPILASGTIKKASLCGGFFNGYVAEPDLRGHKQVRRQSQAKFGEGEQAKREPFGLRRGFARAHKLASGTIFDISAKWADFLLLNNRLFSPILEIFNLMIFINLSDFL